MRTPTLKTARLLLRPFRREDAEAVFYGWESDPDVARYMFWTSHSDIEKTRNWIAQELGRIRQDDWYRFAVTDRVTGVLMGTALLYFDGEVGGWEIGYNFAKDFWGRGYATEAMTAVLSFAGTELHLKTIYARYTEENAVSGRVLQKLGFVHEKDIPYFCNDGAVERVGALMILSLGQKEKTC